MKLLRFAAALLLTLCMVTGVNADEITRTHVDEALDMYNLQQYDDAIIRNIGLDEGQPRYSELVTAALYGELNLPGLLKGMLGIAFSEIIANSMIMRSVIAIAILGAVLKSLQGGFSENSVNEIGLYAIYITLISLLISSFVGAYEIASVAISRMAGFMQALIPLIMALLLASGRYAISFVFNPMALLVTEIAAFAIDKVVLNIIVFAAIVQMVNFLTPAGALDNMTDLAYKVISQGLKWFSIAFMALISIEAAAAPLAGGVIGRSAKALVSAVPVVGGAFKGAVDSVFFWGSAIKNAAAIAAIISILFICIIPVIKLLIIALIYKLTAALIEPFSDDRVVSLIDAAGSYILLFVGAVMCVGVMFITLLMMVIAGAIG